MIFKTLKKTDTGAMSVYNCISDGDRVRPYETVCTTAHEVHSTSESTMSISYINPMEHNSNKSRWDRM